MQRCCTKGRYENRATKGVLRFPLFDGGDGFGAAAAVEGGGDDAARVARALTTGVEPRDVGVLQSLRVAGAFIMPPPA